MSILFRSPFTPPLLLVLSVLLSGAAERLSGQVSDPGWRHLSTPPVTWFRRGKTGWKKYIVESEPLRPEAGSTFGDVDGDGDLDFISAAGGGGPAGNQVWWWENPFPNYEPGRSWKRHFVKQSGGRKHHDLLWADADGDGSSELILWNQGARKLLADIDLDGRSDLIGGGLWFKHAGSGRFIANEIDSRYHFSRSAAGQLIEGGRPEVVLVVGDGVGPLMMYEWRKGTWKGRALVERIDYGHSLAIVDFDGDGHLDIFNAEMRLNGGNPESKAYILLGDGKGGFRKVVVAAGFDNHESKLADLDGDGTLDILGKPYNHQTPSLNIWLNPNGAKVRK